MENMAEFEKRLANLLTQAEAQLGMTNENLAFILLQWGTSYYFKTLEKCERCRLTHQDAKLGALPDFRGLISPG